jgi:hypothetical protein
VSHSLAARSCRSRLGETQNPFRDREPPRLVGPGGVVGRSAGPIPQYSARPHFGWQTAPPDLFFRQRGAGVSLKTLTRRSGGESVAFWTTDRGDRVF